jgi:hypothetical protein
MADNLRTSTSLTSRPVSPLAAELDRKLAGSEPLANVIAWWCAGYFAWRKTQPGPGEGGPSLLDLTDNETTVLTLDIGWSPSLTASSSTGSDEEITEAIKGPDVLPEMPHAWDDLRQARTALRAAVA